MNVLQIVPELKSGGVERGTVDFAKYLVANGHRSVVISAGGSLVQMLTDAGVTHYTLPVHKKSLFSVLGLIKEVSKIIRKEKIDVVHARSRVPAWIAYFACREVQVPLVTTCHGIYSSHGLSRVMGWGKLVISISRAVTRHMKDRFDVPHERIRLIHRGVSLAEFEKADGLQRSVNPSKKDFVVGIVGRITPIKGHRVLLRAMARVCRSFPQAKLRIVGSAPRRRYIDELQIMVKKLGLTDRVEFLGTRQDVPQLLSEMDVLVAPAVGEEAFGRVLIEAGAHGVPVIASRIGGIVDVVEHGKDGILVPAGDSAALAEAIVGVLKEPDYAARLAERLQTKVHEKFNDRQMFEKTLEVYREAIERPKVLILKFSALGDVILSTAAIAAIRKAYPNSHITALVERTSAVALKNNPNLDDVLSFERNRTRFGKWPALHWAKYLSKEYYDVCIDLQNSRFSHFLSWACGAHTRIGYATKKFDFFLNKKLKNKEDLLRPVEHQFRMLSLLGIERNGSVLSLEPSSKDMDAIGTFLKDQWVGPEQQLVGLNPGASRQWKTKQWPIRYYVELIEELSKQNLRAVIMGEERDRKIAEEIVRHCKTKPIIAAGKTSVGGLIALVKRCDAVITPDSAPMHIAASVGTPYVALFGPTDPRRHAPDATQTPHRILWKEIKCSPCYLKKCPIGLKCMHQITVKEVAEAVRSVLRARTPQMA